MLWPPALAHREDAVNGKQAGLRTREERQALLPDRLPMPSHSGCDDPALAYRCGGSGGMGIKAWTAFPFNLLAGRPADTCRLLFRMGEGRAHVKR